MDIFEIDGPVKLTGTIDVAGSKNSALPILAAALLAPGETVIPNAPNLADIRSFEALLASLGAKVRRDDATGLHIDASSGYEAARAIRAAVAPERIQITAQQVPDNLKALVEQGVLFNACSMAQVHAFGQLFPGRSLSIRVNPGLGSGHTNRCNVGGPAEIGRAHV